MVGNGSTENPGGYTFDLTRFATIVVTLVTLDPVKQIWQLLAGNMPRGSPSNAWLMVIGWLVTLWVIFRLADCNARLRRRVQRLENEFSAVRSTLSTK